MELHNWLLSIPGTVLTVMKRGRVISCCIVSVVSRSPLLPHQLNNVGGPGLAGTRRISPDARVRSYLPQCQVTLRRKGSEKC